MDQEQILRLMREFSALGLTGLELETGGCTLRLRREAPAAAAPVPFAPEASCAGPAPAAPSPAAPAIPQASGAAAAEEGRVVRAPLVGTVYAAPSPDAAPYVKVGQQVEKGAPLCLIEAMKMMNEVTAPAAGVVKAILFENGQLASFDQPLVELEEN